MICQCASPQGNKIGPHFHNLSRPPFVMQTTISHNG